MPNFFINKPKPGKPLSLRGLAQGLLNMERAWQTLDVLNGHIEWDKFRPIIVMDAYEEEYQRQATDRNALAWFQVAAATGVEVTGGPITWAHTLLNSGWADKVAALEGTPYAVTYPAAAGDYWLYVQVALASSAVTVAFTADDTYPTDDPASLIVRFPLSLWRVDAEGAAQRVYILHESGRLDVPSNFAPPRTP